MLGEHPVRVAVALAEQPQEQMLRAYLLDAHLAGGGERELQRPLGARRESVDILAGIPPELLELGPHPVEIRAGLAECLGSRVLAGYYTGQQVIRADGVSPRGAGRSLSGTHYGLLGLA